MARGGTRHGSSRSYRPVTRQQYLERIEARGRRAIVTGRWNTFPRMEYMVHEPILGLFGCTNLRKFYFDYFTSCLLIL